MEYDAAEYGDLETLKAIWSDEINIDWQELKGMDLIMTACKAGNEVIVLYLLAYKLDLTKKNKKGQTALNIARKTGTFEIE